MFCGVIRHYRHRTVALRIRDSVRVANVGVQQAYRPDFSTIWPSSPDTVVAYP
jgi:hypothetical protein